MGTGETVTTILTMKVLTNRLKKGSTLKLLLLEIYSKGKALKYRIKLWNMVQRRDFV